MILGPALAVACAVAAARADDPQPEDVLKSHGLSVKTRGLDLRPRRRVGDPAQAQRSPANFQATELRPAGSSTNSNKPSEQRRRMVPALLEERILLRRQLQAVNRQNVILHNQLAARFNEINDQLGLLEVRTGDPRVKQDIDNQVSQQRATLHPGDPRPPRACRLDQSPIRRAGPGRDDQIRPGRPASRSRSPRSSSGLPADSTRVSSSSPTARNRCSARPSR